MATDKPRLTVVLDLHQYEVLERVARVQGRSKGALVRDLVDSVLPGLERVAAFGEMLDEASDEVRATLRRSVTGADEAIGPELLLVEAAVNGLLGRIDGVLSDPPVLTGGSGASDKGIHHDENSEN